MGCQWLQKNYYLSTMRLKSSPHTSHLKVQMSRIPRLSVHGAQSSRGALPPHFSQTIKVVCVLSDLEPGAQGNDGAVHHLKTDWPARRTYSFRRASTTAVPCQRIQISGLGCFLDKRIPEPRQRARGHREFALKF